MASHPAAQDAPNEPRPRDLPELAASDPGGKPAWSQQSEDLNVNLISCTAGQGVGRHLNAEVDVLLVGVAGAGSVAIDGQWHPLPLGSAVIVPKGTSRETRCDGDTFAYLTCHRRRRGLWPGSRTTGGDDQNDASAQGGHP